MLRTHTSNVQIRAMTGRTPPFRFIAPGRVYRHDLSPKHSPMFHQIEGFLVDDRVTFGDLKGVLYAFARHLMGGDIELRFRANHFPFTEPSAEMDIRWRRRVARVGRLRDDPPARARALRHRPRALAGLRLRHGHRSHRACCATASPTLRLLFEGDVRVLEQI